MRMLSRRVGDLEALLDPPAQRQWFRVWQHGDQTLEQAIASHEAAHGPIGNNGVIIRAIVNEPGQTAAHA